MHRFSTKGHNKKRHLHALCIEFLGRNFTPPHFIYWSFPKSQIYATTDIFLLEQGFEGLSRGGKFTQVAYYDCLALRLGEILPQGKGAFANEAELK
jgi:hypothetical protein